MSYKNIIGWVTAVALALYLLAIVAVFGFSKSLPTIVWWLIPFYGILTILLYGNISRSVQKSPTRFVTAVYGAVLIKLMISILIVAAFLYLQPYGRKAFVVAIMGIYSLNSVVLIRSLLPVLRSNNSSSK